MVDLFWLGGGSNRASTPGNWSVGLGGSPSLTGPVNGDSVFFDSAESNTDCEWDLAGVSLVLFSIQNSYSGAVSIRTAGGPYDITTNDLQMSTGTLNVNTDAINITAAAADAADGLNISGGTLNCNTGTIDINDNGATGGHFINTGGTVNGNTSTWTVAGDFNMSAGTNDFSDNGFDLTLDKTSGTQILTTAATGNNELISNLTITAPQVTLQGSVLRINTSFTNSGTLSLNSGVMRVEGIAAITGFNNSGGTINGSFPVRFQHSSTTVTVTNFGTLDSGATFFASGVGSTPIFVLGAALTTVGNVDLDCNDGTNTVTVDCGTVALSCADLTVRTAIGTAILYLGTSTGHVATGDVTINASGTIASTTSAPAATAAKIAVGGDWLPTAGTFTQGIGKLEMTGTATNFSPGSTSNTYYDLSVSGSTTMNSSVDVFVTNIYDGAGGTLDLNMAGQSFFPDMELFTNIGGTITQTAGVLVFRNDTAGPGTETLGDNATPKLGDLTGADVVLDTDQAGATTIIAEAFSCKNLFLSVETPSVNDLTVETTTHNVTVTAQDVNIEFDTVFDQGTGDVSVSGDWTVASGGTYTSNGERVVFTGTGGITVDTPATNSFGELQLNGATTITMQTDITVTSFFIITSGTLDANLSNITHTGPTLTVNGTLDFGTGTGHQILSTTTGGTINGSGAVQMGSSTVEVNVANGVSIDWSSFTVTAGTSTLIYDFHTDISQTITAGLFAGSWNAVQMSLTAPATAPTLIQNNDMSLSGTMVIDSSCTWDTDDSDITSTSGATINGTLRTAADAAGASWTWGANIGVNGTIQVTASTGTFTFTMGSGDQLRHFTGSTSTFTGSASFPISAPAAEFTIETASTTINWDWLNVTSVDVALQVTSSWVSGETAIDNCTFSGTLTDASITGTAVVQLRGTVMTTVPVSTVNVFSNTCALLAERQGVPDEVQVWGVVADISSFSYIGANDFLILRDDDGIGDHADVTLPSGTLDILGIESEANTSLTVSSGATLNLNDTASSPTTQSIATSTIAGTLTFSPGSVSNITLSLLGTMTLTGAFTAAPVVTGTIISISDSKQILVNGTSATMTLSGLTVSGTGGGSAGNIEFNGASTGHTITDCTITGLGGAVGAIVLNDGSGGTITRATFSGNNYDLHHFADGTSAWTINDSDFDGTSVEGFREQVGGPNITFTDCRFRGSFIAFRVLSTAFAGSVRNCLIQTATGIATDQDITQGSFMNCVISGTSNDISTTAAASIHLSGCMLSPTPALTLAAGTELVSWLNNRTNAKSVYVATDLTIDSSFYSVVNADTFDWNTTDDQWDINAANRFESVAGGFTLSSSFIPCLPSTSYDLRFRGDGGTMTVTVTSYEADKATTVTSTSSFTPSGDDYTATSFNSGVGAAFLQWTVTSSAAAEEFYDIDVKQTSDGQLIWNEDLVNAYLWTAQVGNDIDYNLRTLDFESGATDVLRFGAPRYNALDMKMEIVSLSGADTAGFVIAFQNVDDYYHARLEFDEVFIDEYVGGVKNQRFSSTEVAGGTLISTLTAPYTLRVRWNDPNNADAQAFEVFVNTNKVLEADWNNGGPGSATPGEDYVVDASYTTGVIGYRADNAAIDNVCVQHCGFFTDDVTLTLAAGVTSINATDGGCGIDMKDTTTNASQSVFTGSPITLDNVTFAGGADFDETVDGVITIKCDPDLEVGTGLDVVVGPAGELTLIGSILSPAVKGERYRILTESSTSDDAVVTKGSLLSGVTESIRPVDGSGVRYDLDNTFEIVTDGPFAEHPVHIVSNQVYGRQTDRTIVKGHGDREVTLDFVTIDDMCLYGTLQSHMDNETLLEVIWARGVLRPCRVVELALKSNRRGNLGVASFIATFREMR